MALIDRINKASFSQELGATGHQYSGLVLPGNQTSMEKPKVFGEVGTTGLLRTKGTGYIYEEQLRGLDTYRQKQVYREMRDNDAVIGALFFALEMILRKAEWHVEAGKGSKGDKYAEFIETCMKDMSHTWEDFIAEGVSMFAFGFALFETVYKRRMGHDGKQASSQYDDGLIGWRKHAPRSQESILYWIWNDDGGLQGAVQLAAPDYATVPIPIEKLLLLRTTSLKNNPEGRSLLRNCYRSWFYKRRIEEVEGIGIERDLCGIPVLYTSAEALEAMGGAAAAHRLVTNIRVDDQAGVVLPLAYDEKGNPLVKLELLKTAGSKQTDPGGAIARYNSDMLNTVLAGFIQFGQTPTGSRALHMSATQIFSLAITAFMDSISAVINRIAIPRLMQLNKMDLNFRPKLVPGEIGVRDLEELAAYVQSMSQSGLTFFDQPTQEYLRKVARLPEPPEEEIDNAVPPMVPTVDANGFSVPPPPGAPGAPVPPGQPPAQPGMPPNAGAKAPLPKPGQSAEAKPGQPPAPGQVGAPKPGKPMPSAPGQAPPRQGPPPKPGQITDPSLQLKQALINAVHAGLPLDQIQEIVGSMKVEPGAKPGAPGAKAPPPPPEKKPQGGK